MTGADQSRQRRFWRSALTRLLAAVLYAYLNFPASSIAFEGNQGEGAGKAGDTARDTADAILFYGQSNAGAGGNARPILTARQDDLRLVELDVEIFDHVEIVDLPDSGAVLQELGWHEHVVDVHYVFRRDVKRA
jgi:hypothetical protein